MWTKSAENQEHVLVFYAKAQLYLRKFIHVSQHFFSLHFKNTFRVHKTIVKTSRLINVLGLIKWTQFFKGGFTIIEKNNFFEKKNYKEARLPFLSQNFLNLFFYTCRHATSNFTLKKILLAVIRNWFLNSIHSC